MRIRSDGVTATKAIEWARWAARECGVKEHVALRPYGNWCHTLVFGRSSSPRLKHTARVCWLSRAQARARNALYRDRARAYYLDRCKVAWHMANVPWPANGAVASQFVIAFAMKWGCQTNVSRALRLWDMTMRRRPGIHRDGGALE